MLVINFSQYVVLSLFINFPLYVVTRPELVCTLAGAAPISRELCKVKSYAEQQALYTRHSELAAKLQVTKLWRVAAGPFRELSLIIIFITLHSPRTYAVFALLRYLLA